MVETNFCEIIDLTSPLLKKLAPAAFGNMVVNNNEAFTCRLGSSPVGLPFSSVSAVCDFCAHPHQDRNNVEGGTTVICTLTRPENRDFNIVPEDEQMHVLTHYAPDDTDEFSSEDGQKEKLEDGSLNMLTKFERVIKTGPQMKRRHKGLFKAGDNVITEVTDNGDVIANDMMGGLAIALTHGSIVFECAKLEQHATTALKNPDRNRPTRIGIVMFQHRDLGFPDHGNEAKEQYLMDKYHRDYIRYLNGEFLFTSSQVNILKQNGYHFPSDVQVVHDRMAKQNIKDIVPPDLGFLYQLGEQGQQMIKLVKPEVLKVYHEKVTLIENQFNQAQN